MRSLFYKLYFLLTGPLYRRLHRELSLQMQEVVRANIEHHENTSKKILDELLRLSYVVNGGADSVANESTKSMSDTEIAAIIKDVDSSLGMVEVCRKHELPLNTAFLLRSKFRGMTEPAIHRTRELEEQYAELSQKVETLLIENKRLSASSSQSL